MKFRQEYEDAYDNAMKNWDLKNTVTQRTIFYEGFAAGEFESSLVKGLIEALKLADAELDELCSDGFRGVEVNAQIKNALSAHELARNERIKLRNLIGGSR